MVAAFLAFRAAQAQLLEIRGEQRPWVSVDIEGFPIVTVGPKKGDIGVSLLLKNVGRSVANDAVEKFDASGDYNDEATRVLNPCSRDRSLFEIQDVKTLFPSETHITRRYQLLFGGWDFQHSYLPAGLARPSLVVTVSGCVTYTYADSRLLHHTPFAFKVYGSEYSPGQPIGFAVTHYGDFTPTLPPVEVHIPGADPD